MTVYLVMSLPIIPYIHRISVVMANLLFVLADNSGTTPLLTAILNGAKAATELTLEIRYLTRLFPGHSSFDLPLSTSLLQRNSVLLNFACVVVEILLSWLGSENLFIQFNRTTTVANSLCDFVTLMSQMSACVRLHGQPNLFCKESPNQEA